MDINLPTIILQALGFLLLTGLLTKVLYRPILESLDKRVSETNKLMDTAQKNHEEALSALEKARKQLNEAKDDAAKIRDNAKVTATKEREGLLEKTHQEAELVLKNARDEVRRDAEKARQALKAYVSDLAVGISEKMLMREINQEDRKRYIKLFSKEIEEKV